MEGWLLERDLEVRRLGGAWRGTGAAGEVGEVGEEELRLREVVFKVGMGFVGHALHRSRAQKFQGVLPSEGPQSMDFRILDRLCNFIVPAECPSACSRQGLHTLRRDAGKR